MNFLRRLFSPPSVADVKVENFFSKEALGIAPYPEDPIVTALLSEIWNELKSLPFDHKRTAVTIELSETAEQLIVNLENMRALWGNEPYVHKTSLGNVKLYGYDVKVIPDIQMDGEDARVVIALG
jgi:hypothetical protein